jgi:hypothetical protein
MPIAVNDVSSADGNLLNYGPTKEANKTSMTDSTSSTGSTSTTDSTPGDTISISAEAQQMSQTVAQVDTAGTRVPAQPAAPAADVAPAEAADRPGLSDLLLSPWLRKNGATWAQMTSELYRGLRSVNWAEPPKRAAATPDSSFRWGVEPTKEAGQTDPRSFVEESKPAGAKAPRPFAASAYVPSEGEAFGPKKVDASAGPVRWTGLGAFNVKQA